MRGKPFAQKERVGLCSEWDEGFKTVAGGEVWWDGKW